MAQNQSGMDEMNVYYELGGAVFVRRFHQAINVFPKLDRDIHTYLFVVEAKRARRVPSYWDLAVRMIAHTS